MSSPLRSSSGVVALLVACLLFIAGSSARAERLLVVAPHPDDEAIALGGWIADRIASGAEVWVAVLTDGEAFPKAVRASRLARGPFLKATHFLKLGRLRRTEGHHALDRLGIPLARRFFLAYPNRRLWRLATSPRPTEIIRSGATRQRFGIAEWAGERRPPHPFTRERLLADLGAVLERSRPEIILLPHPRDSNADHRAAALLFGEVLSRRDFRGEVRGYLVHQGSRYRFPRRLGYQPHQDLLRPPGFPPPVTYLPSPAGLAAKEAALRSHRSQIRLRDRFLVSFIRRNEYWWPLRLADLTGIRRLPPDLMEQHGSEETGDPPARRVGPVEPAGPTTGLAPRHGPTAPYGARRHATIRPAQPAEEMPHGSRHQAHPG
ncbi:MAG: hypothetical protein OZSIB_1971 [Candidatus Ozemobacter sibiricus]|jgi:LmbE family N-acetylglucosaminyl deacetylase|uniref:PIG-L family deacetylase n=1 Tax=Candidatus Ozemobacter sibiricus TaxID=2268124 RepID=A0A367ZII4_9BACT|nr:MAG: hypothetical protein OZSIB_1971 [Candidatus Ozemobacter sibiricus]